MRETIEEGSRIAAEEAKEQERFQKKLDEASKGSSELKVTMEKFLEQKEVEYQRALKDLELERQRSLDESKQQMKDLRKRMQARNDEVDEDRRKYLKEIDEMRLRFLKRSIESQRSFQQWISDKEKYAPNNYAASIHSSNDRASGSGSFGEAFAQSCGSSVGQVAGAVAASALGTGTLIAESMAAAACNVM